MYDDSNIAIYRSVVYLELTMEAAALFVSEGFYTIEITYRYAESVPFSVGTVNKECLPMANQLEKEGGWQVIPRRHHHVTELNNSFVQEQERIHQEQQRKRRGLKRRLAVLGIISVILGSGVLMAIHTQASTLNVKLAEKAELEQTLEQLQLEEAALKEEIKNYSDLDYIGEIARRDYYLSNKGEVLFKVPH